MNSVLILNKPAGITSHDVVARVRRILGERSVGHLGTLDPMATGVLPLLTGKYTRLAQFFKLADKQYEGTVTFGYATDTYDSQGVQVSDAAPLKLSLQKLDQLADGLRGSISQVPPAYSAKKVAGVPAYKAARQGRAAVLDAIQVSVEQFEFKQLNHNELDFTATVSTGTYIRSLAHELGALAGCGAHLSRLHRTRVGEFTISQAVTLEELEQNIAAGSPVGLHPREVLTDLPSVTADASALARLTNGNAANLPEFSRAKLIKVFRNSSELVVVASRIAGTLFQPKIVLA